MLSAQSNSGEPYKLNWTKQPFDYKIFVENKGQFEGQIPLKSKVYFQATIGKVQAFFTPKGVVYRYQEQPDPKGKAEREKAEREMERNGKLKHEEEKERPVIFLNLIWQGSNPNVAIIADSPEEYYYTYARGEKGTIRSAVYKKLTYKNLYDGIDVEYFFPKDTSGIKYNIIVHPGADLSKVKLKYGGIKKIKIDTQGNAIINAAIIEFTDHAPVSYYEDGSEVTISYKAKKGTVSFLPGSKLDNTKTVIIDPWTTNPLFTGGYNSAYEVDYDDQGNVYSYGAWGPAQLVKFNAAGVIQWKFNATTLNTDPDAQWGDFALDRRTGTCYMVDGYNTAGAKCLKVNNAGTLIATFTGNTNFQEMDRMLYTCSNQLVIGGGGTNATNQGAILDTAMSTIALRNILGANLPYHDIWLLAMDPSGNSCYMGSTNSCCNNNAAYDDRLLNLNFPALTAGSFNNNIRTYTYMPEALSNVLYMTWSGVPANGYNGLVCTPNWLFLFDGADLFKFNKTNGSLIVNRSAVGSTMQSWGGLDADICSNVYVGNNKRISVFNGTSLAAASAATSNIAVSNTIYDLKLGKNYQTLYASGEGFVSSFTISSPPVNISKITVPPTCGSCNGSITANLNKCGTIDTIGATYLWSNGATTHTISGLCPGTYSVTITPSGLCTSFSDTVTLVGGGQNAGVNQSISCVTVPGGTATMAATGTGTWTAQAGNPGTATITSINSPTTTITNFTALGTYNFIWTNGGCSDTAAVTVTSKPNAGADQNISCVTVPGGTATMAATGTGTWTAQAGNPGTATITSINSPTTTITTFSALGTYNFIWTNGGCSDTAAVTLTAKPNAGADQNISCVIVPGGTATMAATGTGTWTAQAGNPGTATIISINSPTTTITTFSALGTYNFIWKNGVCSDTAAVTVTAKPNAGADQNISCVTVPGGTATMVATGTGTWTAQAGNPGTATITSINSPTTTITTFSALGTYNFIWTNGGCSDTTAVIVTARANAGNDTTVCQNSTTVLKAIGTGKWVALPSNPSITFIADSLNNTTSVSGFSSIAIYSFEWIVNGCRDTMNVVVNSIPVLTLSVKNIDCNNPIGVISSGVIGTGPFTYNWSNATTADSIATSISGINYTVTVTDINSCTAVAFDSVRNLSASFSVSSAITNESCVGNNDGKVVLNPTPFGNYNYTWSVAGSADSIFNLSAGKYYFTVTNAQGCKYSDSAIVGTSPNPPVPNVTVSGPLDFCNGDSVILTSSAVSGNLWNTGATSQSIIVKTSGTYSVSYSTGRCNSPVSSQVIVNAKPNPQPQISASSRTFCIGKTITLDANIAPADSYFWSTAESQQIISVGTAGLYQVTVSVSGCVGSDTISVFEQPALGVLLLPDTVLICQGEDVTLDATTKNASSYIWSGGVTASSAIVTVINEGIYNVSVSNNCSSTTASTIIEFKGCNCAIAMPNAFSPNGDGSNDMFSPEFNCENPKSLSMRIFNRWGDKVFETNELSGKWDGRYKGLLQPYEVYVYYVEFIGLENNTEKTFKLIGNVTLLR